MWVNRNAEQEGKAQAGPGEWKQPEEELRTPWSWAGHTNSVPPAQQSYGRQQEVQLDKGPRQAGPADQVDQKAGKQQEGPGDPRGPGGAMYGQPKRKGCLATEDQERAVEVFAGPGMFNEVPQDPEACQGRDADRQQQLDAGKASGGGVATRPSKGKGGGASANEA
eukprot:7628053-Heterocapsa_arctica.AAC.1